MSSCWLLAADSWTILSTAGPHGEHKTVQSEHLHLTCLYMFVLLLMGMRHVPVCDIIAWLYVYACICMTVCVWLMYDCMTRCAWCHEDDQKIYIQLVTACHPTWLRLYQFMLVACPRSISNSVTCRNGMEWTHQHLSGHPEHFPGPWFIYLRAAPLHGCMIRVWLYLYDCMCMIVWQCAYDVVMTATRPYTTRKNV